MKILIALVGFVACVLSFQNCSGTLVDFTPAKLERKTTPISAFELTDFFDPVLILSLIHI